MKRLLGAVAVLAAAGLTAGPQAAGAARSEAARSETAAPNPLSGTSLLSVRRVPDWLEQTAAAQRLGNTIARIAGPHVFSSTHPSACLVVAQGSDDVITANPTTLLIPASNLKLLTATAVLGQLGATSRYTTEVEATAAPVDGVVHGNLYLIGSGDPYLRTQAYDAVVYPPEPLYTSLNQLANQVRAAGVTQVTGSVVGDESRYDQERQVSGWAPEYTEDSDVGPLSALDVNDGFALSHPKSAEGEYLAASDPGQESAAALAALLATDGVRVGGAAISGSAPVGAPLITSIQSAPLAQEMEAMLTVSDDTAAELFTKELGYQQMGKGTTAAGTEAVRTDLAADGLPVTQMLNYDGSGLDRSDRATCTLLADTLEHDGTSSPIATGLPVAGKTGTLFDRMVGTPAAGRLRGKTGTLDGVISLSGYVVPLPASAPTPELGQPVYYSILLNGNVEEEAGEDLVDNIGVALSQYPQVPPLSAVVPEP